MINLPQGFICNQQAHSFSHFNLCEVLIALGLGLNVSYACGIQ
jgi:hypothetical protein